MNPFDFVNSINSVAKNDIMVDDDTEAEYVPFITNRALSYFPETLLHANEMNRTGTDNKRQYHYLLNSVRPAKRFAKWVKRDNIEFINIVKEYYSYSNEKAIQALTILTPDHLHYIKQKLERGGNNDKIRDVGGGEIKNG